MVRGEEIVKTGLKLFRMFLPFLKRASDVVVKKVKVWVVNVFKATRSFIQEVLKNLLERIWESFVRGDVMERIEQMREEYENWIQGREEASEEEAAEEAESEFNVVEAEIEEEEEEETSKLDEMMDRVCEAGNPFVWGN